MLDLVEPLARESPQTSHKLFTPEGVLKLVLDFVYRDSHTFFAERLR